MAVLYRKYRPQTFAQVVGQKSVIRTLQNQIAGGGFAHAYLFTGSRGVGKTSVARIFAKAVNCEKSQISNNKSQNGDACGECAVCKAIEQGNFIDLIEIDAASNTGVDNVRDIIDHVKFSPSTGKFKVFIIDEVHMLSKGAFNALLKTLEEPPKHAIFILATTEIQKVPATIISRTQKFEFKAYVAADIKEHLKTIIEKEKLNYSDEVLELVAQNAGGGMRDALSILDKIITLGQNAETADIRAVLGITDAVLLEQIIMLIANGKTAELPGFFDLLLEKGLDFSAFNKDLLEYLRKILIKKITGEKTENLESLSVNDTIFIIRLFLKSFKDLQSSPSPEIPLLLASVEAALKKKPNNNPGPVAQTKASVVLQPTVSVSEQIVDETVQVAQNTQVPNFDSNVTWDEVMNFWPKVIVKIRDQNGPLGSLLKAAQITSVTDGKIIVQVKYQFDKKTLEKNISLIMQTITEISGKNLGLVGELPDKTLESSNPVAALSDALKIFGGEIIE